MCCPWRIRRSARADRNRRRAAARAAGADAQSLRHAVSPAGRSSEVIATAGERKRRFLPRARCKSTASNCRATSRRFCSAASSARRAAMGEKRITLPVPGDLRAGAHALAGHAQAPAGHPAAGHAAPRLRIQRRDVRAAAADHLPIVQNDRAGPAGRRAVAGARRSTVDLTVGQGPARGVAAQFQRPRGSAAAYSFLAPPRLADSNAVTIATPGRRRRRIFRSAADRRRGKRARSRSGQQPISVRR